MAKSRKKNPFGKKTDVNSPYAVYGVGDWEIRVLRTYKHHTNEDINSYDRWFVAAKSDNTFGSWEYGDTYIRDVVRIFPMIDCTEEWFKAYVGDVE